MRRAGPHLRGMLALAALVGVGAAGCAKAGLGDDAHFDGARAYADVARQCEVGPRVLGSEASRATREYIAAELDRAGWGVERQGFVYDGVDLENIVGRKGRGPVVILGAHYDCRGWADRDAENQAAAVPGANDGASGVAVLLELARTLSPGKLRQEVWLAFFDAEDQGGLNGWPWSVGARHLAGSLTQEAEYVVVVDMVGDADQQLYWERSSTPWLSERVWSVAAALGYGEHFLPEAKHHITDDHTPFLERDIPALDIIDFDYPYWHTTDDTPDKVSAASLERVGRVLECMLESCTGSAESR